MGPAGSSSPKLHQVFYNFSYWSNFLPSNLCFRVMSGPELALDPGLANLLHFCGWWGSAALLVFVCFIPTCITFSYARSWSAELSSRWNSRERYSGTLSQGLLGTLSQGLFCTLWHGLICTLSQWLWCNTWIWEVSLRKAAYAGKAPRPPPYRIRIRINHFLFSVRYVTNWKKG